MSFKRDIVFDKDDVVLPRNLLPLSLGYLRGEDEGKRILLSRFESTERTESIDPLALLRGEQEIPRDKYRDLLIGPPGEESLNLTVTAADVRSVAPRPYVVIIDIGVAYWSQRFREASNYDPPESHFKAVAFMEFKKGTGLATTTVSIDEISTHCTLFDQGGNAAVVNMLAEKFPNSIYGYRNILPSLGPSNFSHGTAMADLILHGSSDIPENINIPNAFMLAIELPAEAYLDRSGDTLQGVVIQAILQAQLLAGNRTPGDGLYIYLPFASLDGPIQNKNITQSVQHTIETLLKDDEHLYLPTGNLRQGQQYSELKDQDREQWSESVTWQIPEADPSSNTVSVHWQGSNSVCLQLTTPSGQHSEFQIKRNHVVTCSVYDTPLIAAHLFAEGDYSSVRISIARTAVLPDLQCVVAPAGQWKLKIKGLDGKLTNLHITILRDDPSGLSGLVRHNRQSYFVDKNYHKRTEMGSYELGDSYDPPSYIKRVGTASYLTVGTLTRRTAVMSVEETGIEDSVGYVDASYSGEPKKQSGEAEKSNSEQMIEFQVGTTRRPWVIATENGSGKAGAVSGTSAAAALAVRDTLLKQ